MKQLLSVEIPAFLMEKVQTLAEKDNMSVEAFLSGLLGCTHTEGVKG